MEDFLTLGLAVSRRLWFEHQGFAAFQALASLRPAPASPISAQALAATMPAHREPCLCLADHPQISPQTPPVSTLISAPPASATASSPRYACSSSASLFLSAMAEE